MAEQMKEHRCSECEHAKECLNMVCFYELLEKEEGKIRADERAKVLDEVRNALLEKADYMETEEGFYGKVVTEKEFEEIMENLKEQIGEGREVD